jgi:hypothetical protein
MPFFLNEVLVFVTSFCHFLGVISFYGLFSWKSALHYISAPLAAVLCPAGHMTAALKSGSQVSFIPQRMAFVCCSVEHFYLFQLGVS